MNSISDEVFINEMHRHLNAINMNKKDRIAYINNLLSQDINRDETLDRYQKNAANKWTKPPIHSEFKEQCDLVAWFKQTYPGVVIMSVRNGGYRLPKEKAEQLREGLHQGASDLFIPAWLCWIEMKRVKGGVQSDKQKEFEAYVQGIGHTYLLCEGFDLARAQIKAFIDIGNMLNK